MTPDTPKVTVLMPVYNGERYLSEAIDSILAQTFGDFEFLIINDGSTDNSVAIISSYLDPRIVLLHNDGNIGLIATLNRGLDLARGEYIARMDCDDISLPERLAKQVAFMSKHPEIGVCGTWFRKIGDARGMVRPPTDPDDIRCRHLFTTMLGHPTVMMRRQLFTKYRLYYDPDYRHTEDYDLWIRVERCSLLANLGEVLFLYRIHNQQVTQRFIEEQTQRTGRIRFSQLAALGISPADEELAFHQTLCNSRFEASREYLKRAEAWLCKIKDANSENKVYPEPAFSKSIMERWFTVCYNSLKQGVWEPGLFFAPGLRKRVGLGWGYTLKFIVKNIIDVGQNKFGT